MNSKLKILLTDGGNKNTLAITRYLGKTGNIIDILHHKKSVPAYSKYCNKLIITPNICQKTDYYLFIKELVKNNKYDLLIPVGTKAVSIFSDHIEELNNYVTIHLAPAEMLDIAMDKSKTFQFAEKNNLPCPKTIYPVSIADALEKVKFLNFPVIIKSSNEALAKYPTIYVKTFTELEPELKKIKNKYFNVDAFPLIQEKIIGQGYGFFAIYQQGTCKRVFMHKRIREYPASGGSSTCALSIFDAELEQMGVTILNKLNWHGPAMVEFKKDENDGKYKLIEINPKFWGSLELTLASGMNFPEFLCEMSQGKILDYSDKYKLNIKFQWIFSDGGELYRILDKPGDIFKVLFDFCRLNSTTDIWIRDIKPNIKEFVNFLLFILKKITKG